MSYSSNISFDQLLTNCQSSDNLLRETSEKRLLSDTHENPDLVFKQLHEVIVSADTSNELKLFAILTIRKLITIYWSDSMPSFNGEKLIGDANLKRTIQDTLLNISVSANNIDSRIINCSVYVIVQIASCDFPDYWPNMIEEVIAKFQNGSNRSILNGLSLLTDLFEDVMTDDLFFVNNIGRSIFKIIVEYVTTIDDLNILKQVFKLYASCITILTTSQIFIEHEDMVVHQLSELNTSIIQKFNNQDVSVKREAFEYCKTYFELIQLLRVNVKKSILNESKPLIKSQILTHLQTATSIYLSDLDTYFDCIEFVDYVIVIISLTSMLLNTFEDSAVIISQCLFNLNKLSDLRKDELMDLNILVEDVFGKDLNVQNFSLRDQIETFYDSTEQHKKAGKQYQDILVDLLLQGFHKGEDTENCLSLLNNCLSHECTNQDITMNITNMYHNIQSLEKLALVRLSFLFPDILPKSSTFINSVFQALVESLDDGVSDQYKKFSLLLFAYRLDTDVALPQIFLIQYLNEIVETVESEKMYPMLEILSKISSNSNSKNDTKLAQFECLLKLVIAKKNLSNVMIYSLINEILENVFEKASLSIFVEIANNCFNDLVKIISERGQGLDMHSLKLSLIILNQFVRQFPENNMLPLEIVQYLIEPVIGLIIEISTITDLDSTFADDDLIDESAILLNNIIKKTNYDVISQFSDDLLNALSAMLSNTTSCNKIGTLTLTFLNKMGNQFTQETLNSIVLKTLEVFTIEANENNFRLSEDLVKVICHFAINHIAYFTEILTRSLDPTAISSFFDKWFDIFESLRGSFLIKCNIISLINISNANILNSLVVKGDIKSNEMWNQDRVITRSMSKKIKIEYEEITLAEKILGVLINESLVQMRSNENEDEDDYSDGGENVDEDDVEDEDGWEDIDDDMNYNQLNDLVKYTVRDDDDDYNDDNESVDTDIDDEDMIWFKITSKNTLQIIIQFLKINVNTPQFRYFYDNKLDHEQRTALTNMLL